MIPRRTLLRSVGPFTGPGLFSQRPATLWFHPSDQGLHLRSGTTCIPAHVSMVSLSRAWLSIAPGAPIRNTTLAMHGHTFATIEHAVSALAGLCIWNAIIEIEGVEAPILDGSAKDFAAGLLDASRVDGVAAPMRLSREVRVVHEPSGATITASPATPGSPARYTYALDTPGLHSQRAGWNVGDEAYATHIAPARTFSLEHEAIAARSLGLFTDFSPKDLLVLREGGEPLENTLRFSDEPARHKLLDLIGDLALLGAPLEANVTAHRSGHALAHELCRAILASETGRSSDSYNTA